MEQEYVLEEEFDTEKSTKKKKMKEAKDEKPKIELVTDLPGIGPATAEKLADAGYDSILSIAVSSPGEMVEIAGVSEAVARKMIQTARASMEMGFESGDQLLRRREKIIRLSTGSTEFDKLLAGGLESAAITECFGQYGSSKTQVAHQLCVNLQKQYPGAIAVYIDTENTFRPERIKEMAKGAELDWNDVLKHIKVARAYNSDHQMLLAEKVEDLIKQGNDVKLVVVDSLTAHFRAEFVGRGTLADRQQKINKHMHALAKVADVYNAVVYVTNQVMAKPDQFFGDPTEAIGGNIVGHNSTFRIYLRKGKKGTRVAKLVDSPSLPDGEATFIVTEDGIRDA